MSRPLALMIWVLGLGLVLWMPGCESKPKADAPRAQGAASVGGDEPGYEGGSEIEAHARRLTEAMAMSNTGSGVELPDPQVLWIEPRDTAPPRKPPTIELTHEPEPEATPEPVATRPSPEPALADPSQLSRRALLDALMDRARHGDGTALQRAIDQTLLTLLEAGRELHPATLAELDAAQREEVARFHSMVLLLRHQLLSGDGTLHRAAAYEAIDSLFGPQTLSIKRVELCRRVEGYGVYEPFEGRTFLAGRDNRMIVYVELDNFRSVDVGRGLHEVRLDQEVALFTDWDGQKVWQHQTQEIVDRSRNQRRDFFVVQMITLPARLSVGKYVLKVDVTDKHGGSVDGVPIEINLVADPALVAADRGGDRQRVDLIRKLLEEDDARPLMDKP